MPLLLLPYHSLNVFIKPSSNIPEYETSAEVYEAISDALKASTRLEFQSSFCIVATDPKVDTKTRLHSIATELRQSTDLNFSFVLFLSAFAALPQL